MHRPVRVRCNTVPAVTDLAGGRRRIRSIRGRAFSRQACRPRTRHRQTRRASEALAKCSMHRSSTPNRATNSSSPAIRSPMTDRRYATLRRGLILEHLANLSYLTGDNTEPHRINPFPIIHASDMASGYDDEIKFLCFETIANLAQKFGVHFLYLGYFHRIPLLVSKIDLLVLSINQLCDLITSSESENLVFVYELNSGKHVQISRAYNDYQIHYLREIIGERNVSVKNSENIIGRYYCDKLNYHMAVTDAACWVRNLNAMKLQGETMTKFKAAVLNRTKSIRDLFVFDEIIQLNKWPYDPRTGAAPARYVHNITPSDDKTLSTQFQEFLGKLEIYWTEGDGK